MVYVCVCVYMYLCLYMRMFRADMLFQQLSAYNTRLFKYKENGDDVYEIRLASAKTSGLFLYNNTLLYTGMCLCEWYNM